MIILANSFLIAANLGGVMGLCLGFSLLSLIEVIYWFTLRFFLDKRNFNHANETADQVVKIGFQPNFVTQPFAE